MPCEYTDAERRVLAPFLAVARAVELPEPLAPTGRPMVEGIVAMNRWIADAIAYERRDDGDPLSPQESLRSSGVTARLVSGFLLEGHAEERRAASAMHAWVEAYLPGAGWVGLDPTHGVLCDDCFVPTAVGLRTADAAVTGRSRWSSRVATGRGTSSA